MSKGVDLSQWQKGLTIAAAKKAGYEFVILRGGYTGYGATRSKNKDTCFEDFYKQAKAAKMPVGCYWYSCANTKQGGIDEANYLYTNCLKGKQFEYSIYIDVEEKRWQANDKKGVTDAIIGFCETLESKGYYVGIYASLSWFNTKIDTSRLDSYTKWVAAWGSSVPSFKYKGFDLWQNSDNGKVGNYRVDTNVSYKDFTKTIKAKGLNGFSKSTNSNTSGGNTAVKKYGNAAMVVAQSTYADSDLTLKVGFVGMNERVLYLGTGEGRPIIAYQTKNGYKVGFVGKGSVKRD